MIEIALWLVVGVLLAMVVHELGHVLAARAIGGRDVRVVRRGMIFSVDAVLPSPRADVIFLISGAAANLICALALVVSGLALLGLIQFACAVVNLVPHGTSDGAKLRHRHLSRSSASGLTP